MLLAGDIGGTKALLALYTDGRPEFEKSYASRDFADFDSLVARFLEEAGAELRSAPRIDAACFGLAGPVEGGRVRVTNLPWIVDASSVGTRFGLGRTRLINDFVAAAWGIGRLARGDLVTLQAGEPAARGPRVVLGAGTGLGIAYVAHGVEPIAGEGGHASFAPATEEQVELWRHLHARVGRATLEHVLSGAGLARQYEFVRDRAGLAESAELRAAIAGADPAAVISRFAMERADPLATAALDLFIACYGTVAGDHALNVMARGGVFIVGGIARKILPRLSAGGFLAAFNDKGEFGSHTRRVPLHVVTNERVGLIGAAAAAQGLMGNVENAMSATSTNSCTAAEPQ